MTRQVALKWWPVLMLVGLVGLSSDAVAGSRSQRIQSFNLITHAPADSINGGATITTDAVPCFGAAAVVFFVRDSVPSTAYVDSFSTAQIQFSNDGTNWVTRSLSTYGYGSIDTLYIDYYGRLLNTRLRPEQTGGYRVVAVVPAGPSTSVPQAIPFLYNIRFVRLNLVTATRFASPSVTGDADMIGLRIRAHVIYNGFDSPMRQESF